MSKRTITRGRDAKTGRFIPIEVARRREATAVVTRMKRRCD